MNTYIYVISDGKSLDEFKIGKHTGDKKSLDKRYITYYPNYQLHYFEYHSDHKNDERKILDELSKYRIRNRNSNKSEWIKCSLSTILNTINSIIAKKQDTVIKTNKQNRGTELNHIKKCKCYYRTIDEKKELVQTSLTRINKHFNCKYHIDTTNEDCTQVQLQSLGESHLCPISGEIHTHSSNEIDDGKYTSGFIRVTNSGKVLLSCSHGCKIQLDGEDKDNIDITPYTGNIAIDIYHELVCLKNNTDK